MQPQSESSGKACKPGLADAAFGLLSPVWSVLLRSGMTLGVLLNSYNQSASSSLTYHLCRALWRKL
ncbi:MAG: hypothetical protein H6975_10120 [Gammaproteobacteria bacterium]|nr:hypothetical protein [Gammaproteobacteria bacterium]